MPTRSRSRTVGVGPTGYTQSGYQNLWNNPNPNTIQILQRETMTDTTSPLPYPDHPLFYERRTAQPITFNGYSESGGYKQRYQIYAPTNRAGYAYTPTPTVVDWGYYKTKALANMNPSKPTMDLPVFIAELRDFPHMLHQAGRVLDRTLKASDFAGAYVAYSFGWAPLISDLSKLLDFEKVLSDRLKYLQRISKAGGDRVKRTLENSTTTLSSGSYIIPGYGNTYTKLYDGSYSIVEKRKVWATAKVRSLGQLPLDRSALGPAARAALGLNLSAASLWEAIPWSWLIDYFVNVGDVLDATRGFIPASITNMCIMCTQNVENKLTGRVLIPGVTSSGSGTLTTIRKQRSVSAYPTPSLTFTPWFTPHMGGILASLSTSRALRSLGK